MLSFPFSLTLMPWQAMRTAATHSGRACAVMATTPPSPPRSYRVSVVESASRAGENLKHKKRNEGIFELKNHARKLT